MNKEVKETTKNLQNNELVKNGSYEFIGDSNITYAEIYVLLKFIGDLQQKNKQLKDNWNKLKEYLKAWEKNEKYCYLANSPIDRCRKDIYGEILDKMQELEQGSGK